MKESETKLPETKPEMKSGKMKGKVAKKDHVILQNDYEVVIKKGEDLGKIPDRYENTLKAEGVL